jgi:hypothetical protein
VTGVPEIVPRRVGQWLEAPTAHLD